MVGRCADAAQENPPPSGGLLRVCSSSRAWWAPISRATEDGQNATADGPVASIPPAIMPDSARSDGRAAGSLARQAAMTVRSRGGIPSRTGSACTTRYKMAAAVPVPDASRRHVRRGLSTTEIPTPVHGPDYVHPPRVYREVAPGHVVTRTLTAVP